MHNTFQIPGGQLGRLPIELCGSREISIQRVIALFLESLSRIVDKLSEVLGGTEALGRQIRLGALLTSNMLRAEMEVLKAAQVWEAEEVIAAHKEAAAEC